MSAIRHLKTLAPYTKLSGTAEQNCMSPLFLLVTNFTTAMLIASSLILGASEYLGKPINCMSSLPQNIINNYCWISKTFTMHDYSNRETGHQAVAPGVYSPEAYDDDAIQEKWRFHNYYQWVVFFLCFQAFLCYFPKYLWNTWEGGLMKSISQNLSLSIFKESEVAPKKTIIVNYILSHLKMHNIYVYKYWFCELLCFITIIAQLFIIDKFLGGEFMTYGFKVLDFSEMDQVQRVDPMIFVFPRMTKCLFYVFGASGTIERKDAFCLLTQNILNEKIFILIWVWYIILGIGLGGLLLYRILLIVLPVLRLKIMYYHTKIVPMETLQIISKRTSIGDWWIFYHLSSAVNGHIFRDILNHLARELETNASNRAEYSNQNSNGHIANGAHGSNSNGPDGRGMYPYFPHANAQGASAPPAGYAQSAV